VRFKFGYAELRNPLGVAWHEGLLWIADGNNQSGHASPQGKLVAFSFAAPGPLAVSHSPHDHGARHACGPRVCPRTPPRDVPRREGDALLQAGYAWGVANAGLDRARAGYTVRGMLMMRDARCALTARGWSPAHAPSLSSACARARALTLCAALSPCSGLLGTRRPEHLRQRAALHAAHDDEAVPARGASGAAGGHRGGPPGRQPTICRGLLEPERSRV
jgi:hypothetical protein